jgi:hypothetical protein
MLFSPDGKKLFYTSKRPEKLGDPPEEHENIWVVTKKDGGWSEPEKLNAPINTEGSENYASVSLKGSMYFHRYEIGTNKTDSDIFVANYIDGKYEEPKRLVEEVNSKFDEWDVRWDNIITAQVTKLINVNLNVLLIYDTDQIARTQLKEALQIGITYALF